MKRTSGIFGVVALTMLTVCGPARAAEGPRVEIRTWAGHSLRVGDSAFDLLSTVTPKTDEAKVGSAAPSAATAGVAGAAGGSSSQGARLFGTTQEIGALIDKGAQPLQVRRQATSIPIVKGGVETRIPIERLASLLFFRQPMWTSSLPPYVAPSHYRYSATAIMVDGSRVEGDYVNLGTLRLRGTTSEGRVDVSWEDLEVVRFER